MTIKCLKGAFIGINILLAIAGVLFIASASTLHFFMQSQDMDVSLVGEVLGLSGAGILVVTTLGVYGASKDKIWPLTAFITATLIGMIVFLMQAVQAVKLRPVIMKYMNHYMKSEDAKKTIVKGLDAGLGAMFGLAGLEVILIILAAVIFHQIRRYQAAIPNSTSGGTNPPSYSELCPMTSIVNTEQTTGDSPKLLEIL